MGRKEQEKKVGKLLDPIRPSAELRKAISGLEVCIGTFNRLGIIGFLKAINETYLDNKGEITGPEERIATNLKDNTEPSTVPDRHLDLMDIWLNVDAYLKWKVKENTNRISATLCHYKSGSYNLILYAESIEEINAQGMKIGSTIQRDFGLTNDIEFHRSLVDDTLLTFTTELLDSGFIAYK